MIKFNSSPEPTIGVEIELQIVDKNNLDLNNTSSKVLAEIDKEFLDKIKCELIESKYYYFIVIMVGVVLTKYFFFN